MKICVYTVLLGSYDELLVQEVASRSGADFICFTDDPDLQAAGWDVYHVAPYLPQDLHRSSRVYKILGHERLDGYDVTICIDASVLLKSTPEEIVAGWLSEDTDIALAFHSFRQTVLEEFDEVVRLNYDDRSRVYEQLTDYAMQYPDVLEERPRWGGLIVRRRNARVDATMRLWFDQVLRYSRRDQLSLLVALTRGSARVRTMEVDNFESSFHRWPVIGARRVGMGKAPDLPSGPLIADLRRARLRVTELEAQIAQFDHAAMHALQLSLEQSKVEIEQGTQERQRLEHQLADARRVGWEHERALDQSTSVSGAARALGRAVRHAIRRK